MADINSNLPSRDSSDGSVGSAVPSIAIQIAGKNNSGNLTPILIDAQGGAIIAGEGTAGTPTGGVVSIQGVVNGTPLVDNITQFGGNAVVTGIGVSGVGIPRVTVSNDSSITVNASSNIIGNVRIDQTTPGTTNAVQANAGTNLNTSSLALSANQTNGTQKNQIVDGSGNTIPSTLINTKQRLDVDLSSEGIDGSTLPFSTVQVGGTDGTNLQTLSTDVAGRLNVTIYKPLTPSAPTFATVAATSGSALALNATRKGLIMTNTSKNIISLNIVGGAAVLNSGITLYPGWVWYMDEFSFTTSAIFAIASAAGSNLSIQEQD